MVCLEVWKTQLPDVFLVQVPPVQVSMMLIKNTGESYRCVGDDHSLSERDSSWSKNSGEDLLK